MLLFSMWLVYVQRKKKKKCWQTEENKNGAEKEKEKNAIIINVIKLI